MINAEENTSDQSGGDFDVKWKPRDHLPQKRQLAELGEIVLLKVVDRLRDVSEVWGAWETTREFRKGRGICDVPTL